MLLWIDMWLDFEKNFLYLTFSQLTLSQSNDLIYVIAKIYILCAHKRLDSDSSFLFAFRVQLFWFRLDIFVWFKIFIDSRFRQNSDSEICESIFTSIILKYSSIINFDFDLNISRQSTIESNTTSSERR